MLLEADAQIKICLCHKVGLWKWKVLPFSLALAPATFQCLMEQVLKGLDWTTALFYLDDVIVILPNFTTYLHRLEEVLQKLQSAGMKLKPQK